jgi:hypothetical protein
MKPYELYLETKQTKTKLKLPLLLDQPSAGSEMKPLT